MNAFTDIGWFLYISLDSYKVWMHLQTLVGINTYLLILIKYGCTYRLVGFYTYLLILIKYGCIYRHWLVSIHIS